MTVSRRQLSLGLLALAALPVACASPSPTLYTLDAVPGAVQPGGPRVVILQDVGLAPYLDRKPIVRSSAAYHIAVETNSWWGETPSAMIGRVLVTELDQRLTGTKVFQESSTVTPQADATLSVNITRFDRDEHGSVILVAEVEVTYSGNVRPPLVDSLSFTAQPPTPDVVGQVQAMSTALGLLADRLATDLSH